MITNQPDVSRNKIKKKDVRKINEYLKYFFHLNDVYVCYHDNKDNCDCRKPKPGMILKSKKKWNIDLKKSFLIGDKKTDIVCAKKFAIKGHLFRNGNLLDFIKSSPKR